MKTTLDQADWDRICWLIENECNPDKHFGIMKVYGGYCIAFDGGAMHPATFLDLFDGPEPEEPHVDCFSCLTEISEKLNKYRATTPKIGPESV